MSLASGAKPQTDRIGMSAARRTLAPVRGWLALMVRQRRVPARPGRLWPLSGRIAIGALIMIVALIGTMFVADIWALRQAQQLPQWVIATFDEITDFGKSGWFLWPLGVVLIALAAISSALPRFALLVMTAI